MERNLNDIIPPSRRRALLGDAVPTHDSAPPPPSRPQKVRKQRTASGKRFPMGTALIALVVIVLSGVALYVFSKATVTVYPTEHTVSLSGDLIATASTGDLPFEVITLEKIATKNVKSEGTVNVQQAAQGSIQITNTQAVPQQLIKNTRFESADGHIFRIHDSVTVPAGKDGAPGSLTVTVYADAVGDSFNIPATTFKLPGLKGSKAFDLVTAKSTDAMAGGFSGARPSVAQSTKDKEYASLKSELSEQTKKAIEEKVPEGYVLLSGATFTSYVEVPDAPATGGEVTLSQKAVVTAVVFPRAALASKIAYANDGTYNGEPVTLTGESGLTLTSANGAAPALADQEFAFKLDGSALVRWSIDSVKIAGAVAGKNRQSAEVALTGFPELNRATFVIRPFWSSTFPTDPSKIEIVVSEPSEAK